jgi:methyl-accepting chemotaxis protein
MIAPSLPLRQTAGMKLALTLLLVAAAAVFLTVLLRRSGGRRQEAVGRLLDAADALETRLRTARAEIEAVTGDENPTRDAMQEMLRQRLWLQQHGGDASLEQLDDVRTSLEQARERIDQQLQRIQQARAPMV